MALMISSWRLGLGALREFWFCCQKNGIMIYRSGLIGNDDQAWVLVCERDPRLAWLLLKYSQDIEVKDHTVTFGKSQY